MEQYNFVICNADTDSISFRKEDHSPFSEEEQEKLLKELNSLYPEKIKWEHDGIFEVFVVVKAKNYIKLHDGVLEIKGSGLKDPKKQPAIREFTDKVINCLVYDKTNEILNIYNEYIREINNLKDICRWVRKMTITESVLNPKRTTEQKILNALEGKKMQQGDKIYVFFKQDESLCLQENWNNNHHPVKLMASLYNSLNTFKNVLDMTQFPKYHLKSYKIQCQLAEVLGNPIPEKVKRPRKPKVETIGFSCTHDSPHPEDDYYVSEDEGN
jgi:hypothetical protein